MQSKLLTSCNSIGRSPDGFPSFLMDGEVIIVFKRSYGVPASLWLPARLLGIIGRSPDDLGTLCTTGS